MEETPEKEGILEQIAMDRTYSENERREIDKNMENRVVEGDEEEQENWRDTV